MHWMLLHVRENRLELINGWRLVSVLRFCVISGYVGFGFWLDEKWITLVWKDLDCSWMARRFWFKQRCIYEHGYRWSKKRGGTCS